MTAAFEELEKLLKDATSHLRSDNKPVDEVDHEARNKEHLTKILQQPTSYPIGTEVRLTEAGNRRYRRPNYDKGDRAFVSHLFQPPIYDESSIVNAEVTAFLHEAKDHITTFLIDLRYFEEVPKKDA